MKRVLHVLLVMAMMSSQLCFAGIELSQANFHQSYKIPWSGDVVGSDKINTAIFFDWYAQNYLKDLPITWEIVKSDLDDIGMEHIRFQQKYNGVKVEHGVMILHLSGGNVESFNGEIYPSFSKGIASSGQIVDNYLTDNPGMQISKNSETVYMVDEFGVAQLCSVYMAGNEELQQLDKLFVTTINELIIRIEPQHIDADAKGSANTYFVGTQKIVTDSLTKTSFRLRETARPIRTYKGKLGDDFYDSDNYWNNSGEQIGTDIHYGMQLLHTFLQDKFKWDSYANRKDSMVSVTNLSGSGNAYWNLAGNYATFLAGSSSSVGPCAAIDVVGHEFGHGIADENAGLVYSGESCMLHESFGDINGTLLEWYHDSTKYDWLLGEKVWSGGIRNMKNPNAFSHPDTYKGKFFSSSGCHNNGGVQNYWFYLMVKGDTGTNDFGDKYSVKGMGFEKSMAILYRAMFYYWTANTTYPDANTYALKAARDLYGSCSDELRMTYDAWKAVGLEDKNFILVDLTSEIIAPKVVCAVIPETVRLTSKGDQNRKVTWYFSNGDSSNNFAYDYVAKSTGSHTFILKTEVCGFAMWDTAVSTITYQPEAKISINKILACNNGSDSIIATNNTVNQDASKGLICEWTVWPFGDVYSSKDLSILVKSKLDLNIILKASYAGGCWDTVGVNITVNDVPELSFTAQSSCVGDSLKISNTTDHINQKLDFKWYLNDSLKSDVFMPSIVVNKQGAYTIKVTGFDPKTGCSSAASLPTIVYGLPEPKFKLLNPCTGQDIVVVNTTNHTSPPNYIRWFLPDSKPYNKDTVVVTSSLNNQVIIGLEYKDQKGCFGVSFDTLKLENLKSSFAVVDSICSKQDLLIKSTSEPKMASNHWYLNHVLVASDSILELKQIAAGKYQVKQVTKGVKCADSTTRILTSIELPNPSFTLKNEVCDGEKVVVENTSQSQSGSETTFSWLWGDGASSSGDSVKHTYTLPISTETESFVVTLKAKDAFGCEGQMAKSVTVNAPPICEFDYSVNGLSVEFAPITKESKYVYSWDFGDGNTSSVMSPTHVFGSRDYYDVSLNVITNIGCDCALSKKDILGKVSIPQPSYQSIILMPNPTTGSFSISGFTSNETQVMTLTDLSGRVILRSSFLPSQGQMDFEIDLPSGIYNVNLQSGVKSVNKKLTVVAP